MNIVGTIGKKGLKTGMHTFKAILLVLTVLMGLLLVASAWGGYVNPNRFSFFSVLTLGLPLILIINFVMLLVWLLVLQWRYALISLAAIMLSWGA